MAKRQKLEAIVRNQNIHLQPGPEAKAPPRTGPRLRAVVILGALVFCLLQSKNYACPNERAETKAPLSAGVEMSAMTPYATENVPTAIVNPIACVKEVVCSPEMPALCSIRSSNRATAERWSAMPILAPTYSVRVIAYKGRLPNVSAASPTTAEVRSDSEINHTDRRAKVVGDDRDCRVVDEAA